MRNHAAIAFFTRSIFVCVCAAYVSLYVQPVFAQTSLPNPSPLQEEATDSAEATESAQHESSQTVMEQGNKDITDSRGEAKSALVQFLESTPAEPLSPTNMLQHAIRAAVDRGVPANILVLLLLFPLVASLVAVFRHVIGLSGFGVYTPAALAVAFVSTGFTRGFILFSIIFAATWVGKWFVSLFKLQYLPRTALLLWFVSLSMFGALLATPYLGLQDIALVGFFPILVLVLLSENFMEAQMTGTISSAVKLTIETLLLASLSALVMRTLKVQQFVILNPEMTVMIIFILNLIIGRYTGLRVLEYFRFKQIIEPQEE